jgi:hypothetical protein
MEAAGLDTPVAGEPWHVQASKKAPTMLASVTDNRVPVSKPITQPQAGPTVIQQTNVVSNPDLRFFMDDPFLRSNNHTGV